MTTFQKMKDNMISGQFLPGLIKDKRLLSVFSEIEREKYLDSKVFLKTWVKVKKNWNTDSGFINSLGVGNKHESK